MGGRGTSSGGSDLGSGRDTGVKILSTNDLTSQRERKQKEVDETLSVLRNVNEQYGYVVNGTSVAKLGKGSRAMAYYNPSSGEIGVNEKYFDSKKMDGAYDRCVKSKFHPSRGKKTGMEATIAHESGHALTHEAAKRNKMSFEAMESKIVSEAIGGKTKTATKKKANRISGYATKNNGECIAEAFADVFCNGQKAKRESKKVVKVLNKYLK